MQTVLASLLTVNATMSSQWQVAWRCADTHKCIWSLLEHVGLGLLRHLRVAVRRGCHQGWVHTRGPDLIVRFDIGILNVRVPGILISS